MVGTPAPNRCGCGRMPAIRAARVAEDCMETWVHCPGCGRESDRIEDAYTDADTAAANWNATGGRKPK